MRNYGNILQAARIHPITTKHVQLLGGFLTLNAAQVWAGKAVRQGKLTYVGCVSMGNGGHPLSVFCNGWAPRSLRHELHLTDFCLLYWLIAQFVRGFDVDPKTKADAEMTLGQFRYRIELDCGTMPKDRMIRRWRSYRNCEDTLLVVCASNPLQGIDSTERMHELMRWSESVADIAVFATLESVMADPWGPVWHEIGGGMKALKKPAQKPLQKPAQIDGGSRPTDESEADDAMAFNDDQSV